MDQAREHQKYEAWIAACRALSPMRTGVVHPCDESSLVGALNAAATGLIRALLIGPEARIRTLAASEAAALSGLNQRDRSRPERQPGEVELIQPRGVLFVVTERVV